MKENSTNRKIKVLQIITKSDWAGAQRIVYEICKGIKENFTSEIEVEVAMGGDGPLFKLLEEIGIKTHKMEYLRRPINPVSDIKAYKKLKKLIKEGGYDVVHCHSSKAGLIGRLAAKSSDIENIVYTVHGWWGVTQYKGLKKNFILFVERFMAKRTSKLVFVCNKDKEYAKNNRIGEDTQYEVIVNQITVPKFTKGKLRAMLDLPDSTKIVGNVARLSPQKNPMRFVEVAARVLKNRNDTVFVWIGDGELMDRTIMHSRQLGIADNIKFVGFHQNGAELMADFNCLLMTSDDEGLPITILEALAQGIPVVSTDVGGIRELLDSRVRIVSLEDSVEIKLASALLKAFEESPTVLPTHSSKSYRMLEDYIALYKRKDKEEQLNDVR